MAIWDKGYDIDREVLAYTVGKRLHRRSEARTLRLSSLGRSRKDASRNRHSGAGTSSSNCSKGSMRS